MRDITALYVVGTDAPEDIRFASPYDLFRRSDGMSTLLTACGEPPELLPDGGAPDYDKLAALCRALPLAPGPPLRCRILALLAEGFEWHDPRPDTVHFPRCAGKRSDACRTCPPYGGST